MVLFGILNHEETDIDKLSSLTEVKGMLATLREKIHESGKREGKREGKRDGVFETARNMKAEGLNEALIARITGLKVTDIRKL